MFVVAELGRRNVHRAAVLYAASAWLLEKLLADPGTGFTVGNAMLRLDADYEPIRNDPAFQALMKAHQGSGDVGE